MKKNLKNAQLYNGKVSSETRVTLQMPGELSIELVPASEFKYYELALWLGSLFMSAAVGFWTTYITFVAASGSNSTVLLGSSIVFTIFTIVFVGGGVYYRAKLQNGKVKSFVNLKKFR